MPLKTNVGISRKVADNNYGSRGASINLEVELDSSLIQEPERLQERIRQVFRMAQAAVDEELARQNTPNGQANGNGHAPAANGNGNGHNGNGVEGSHHGTNGNGQATNGNGHRNGQNGSPASEKQLGYARQLAKAIQGLGIRRLEPLAERMFGKPLVALTSMDASGLIDTLKAIKEGTISLDAALEGSTP